MDAPAQHLLLKEIRLDPDARIVPVPGRRIAAGAPLFGLDGFSRTTNQQPVTDPPGYRGIGVLDFDVATTRVSS